MITTARNELYDLVYQATKDLGHPVLYDDKDTEIPSQDVTWMRVSVRNTGRKIEGWGNGHIFDVKGILTIQIFTPTNDGRHTADELSELLLAALDGQTTPCNVLVRNPQMIEVGLDGGWTATNVLADFIYHNHRSYS